MIYVSIFNYNFVNSAHGITRWRKPFDSSDNMCGICGRLSWHEPANEELIGKICQRMAHRGPDDEGVWTDGPMTLGHRRLSVIDPSPAGHQPMADHSGRFWIVYNGEIYNFPTLREELTALGARFATRTDTETILEAYKRWGAGLLPHLNGMFAFALWDRDERTLFLARDRLGKKPLFYHESADGGITFASEIAALREAPEVPGALDYQGLSQFLSMGYTLSPDTLLEGVRQLEPAHYLLLAEGKAPIIRRYWELADAAGAPARYVSENAASEALIELLDDAVRIRLISDVPLGAFLSGGVDSAGIVASMTHHGEPSATKTFSIGFQEETYSEVEEARDAARHFGVDHKDRTVDADLAVSLPRIVALSGQPLADTSIIPTYYLAEFARRHVTVSLSGDGGDEVFLGYETYAADRLHAVSAFVPGWLTGLLARSLDGVLPASRGRVSFDYKLRQFLRYHGQPFERAHYAWRTIFSDEEKQWLLNPNASRKVMQADPFEGFRRFYDEIPDAHYLDRASYVDIKTWLVDDILVKVDRATMAHSLEARAPYLDYRVVEFALSLPAAMKMKGLQKKWLLKRSLSQRVPAETLRRKKMGFNAPITHWFDNTLAPFVQSVIDSDDGVSAELFNREYIRRLMEEHRSGKRDHSLKLFVIITFDLWARSGGAVSV